MMDKKYFSQLGLVLISAVIGLIGGLSGAVFSHAISFVTSLREDHGFILYLLPFTGIIIVFLNRHLSGISHGTHAVIEAAKHSGNIPISLGSDIFISTVLTHLSGGSAGREGAALQLGGSFGSYIGKAAKLDTEKRKITVLCGMSAVFSALFGTPLTACVFVCELTATKFIAIKPLFYCLISSFISFFTAKFWGVSPERFTLNSVPDYSPKSILISALVGILCSLVAYLFHICLTYGEKLFEKLFPNAYLRILTAGIIIIIFTLFLGRDYCGGGNNLIEKSLEGHVIPEAFLLKIMLTTVTVSGGYKGGEIVPTLSIGATFGALVGLVTGFSPALCAACGMISLFSALTDCPLASLLLSAELLSGSGFFFTAISAFVAFVPASKINIFNAATFESEAVKNIFRKSAKNFRHK